jgi:hypothetical protein
MSKRPKHSSGVSSEILDDSSLITLKFAYGRSLSLKKSVLCEQLDYFRALFSQPGFKETTITIAEDELANERFFFILWATSEVEIFCNSYALIPCIVLSNYYALSEKGSTALCDWARREVTDEFVQTHKVMLKKYWKRCYTPFRFLECILSKSAFTFPKPSYFFRLVLLWLDGESCTTAEQLSELYGSTDFLGAKKLLKAQRCVPTDRHLLCTFASEFKVSINILDAYDILVMFSNVPR